MLSLELQDSISIQETLAAWLQCQTGWVHLEPVFGSDDIENHMPNEGRKFRVVDTAWRTTMAKLQKVSEAMQVTADAELLRTLQDANSLLEQVCTCLATAHLMSMAASTARAISSRQVNGSARPA